MPQTLTHRVTLYKVNHLWAWVEHEPHGIAVKASLAETFDSFNDAIVNYFESEGYSYPDRAPKRGDEWQYSTAYVDRTPFPGSETSSHLLKSKKIPYRWEQ